MIPEYPKVDTLFERDEKFRVDVTRIRRPEFLVPQEWLVTEKIDGTNVRVSLESRHPETCGYVRAMTANGYKLKPEVKTDCGCEPDWVVRFYGRTAAAQMPTFLLDYLQRTFTLEKMQRLWRGDPKCPQCHAKNMEWACACVEPYPIVLYGEGYGARIQKGGGSYRRDGDVSFRLFDVLIGGTWLSRSNVEDIAKRLDVKSVPMIFRHPMLRGEVLALTAAGFASSVANEEGTLGSLAEGVVAFTDPPLFNGRGQRLMWKLKTKDFPAIRQDTSPDAVGGQDSSAAHMRRAARLAGEAVARRAPSM